MKKIIIILCILLSYYVGNSQLPAVKYYISKGGNMLTTTVVRADIFPTLNTTAMNAISSPPNGLIIFNSDSLRYMVYMGTWKGLKYTDEGGGGISAIGAINSQTKSANGAVISGTDLVMQTVDATYPGLMTSALKAKYDSLYNGDVRDSISYVTRIGAGSYDTLKVLVYAFPAYTTVDSTKIGLVPKLGGGTPTLEQVLTAGNTATTDLNAATLTWNNSSDALGQLTYASIFGQKYGQVNFQNTANAHTVKLYSEPLTASREILLPDKAGTIALTSDISGSSGITVGTTTITSGTSGRVPYNNAGVYGEKSVTGTGDVVLATSPTLITPNLGTPSTLVGTNISGTINTRWKARVGSTTSSATPTINTDNVDIYKLTAQTANITSFTTNLSGTPNDGDVLEIQVTGTAARTLAFGSSFVASTVALPTTTVTTATLTVIFQYYTTSSYGNNKWVCVNSY